VSTMEGALTARDRVGVQDFVLLEDYTSENAFLSNLRKRFKEKLIYVSIVFAVYLHFVLTVVAVVTETSTVCLSTF